MDFLRYLPALTTRRNFYSTNSTLCTAGLFPKRLFQLPYNFKPIYICFNWNRFNWITKNRTRASKLLLIPWQESRYVQTFLRGRVFLRIVIHTHAIISWCSLWELLTVRQPPISPCRTPRRCSRPRASWGRCQRRARPLESSFCNCYSKWSRSLSFLRRNSRDRTPLHGLKEGRDEHENGRYQRRHPCRSSWWLLRRITFPGSKDNRHSVRGGAERKEISACAAEQSKFRSCRQQTHFLSQKRRLAA